MAPTTVSATTEGGPAAAPWARGRKARAVTALETEARHTGAVLGAVPGMRGAARREVTASWCTPPQATHSPAGSAQSAWTRPSVRAGRGASGVQLVPPPATRTRRITPPAPASRELRRLELSDGAAQRRCSHRTRGGAQLRFARLTCQHLLLPIARADADNGTRGVVFGDLLNHAGHAGPCRAARSPECGSSCLRAAALQAAASAQRTASPPPAGVEGHSRQVRGLPLALRTAAP